MKAESVWCVLIKDGKNIGHHVCDLIFIQDIPHLVYLWTSAAGQPEFPARRVPLDPTKLHDLNWPQARYMYERPVDVTQAPATKDS